MSIFPLDSIRNATIDREIELVLEDVREEVAAFPFSREENHGDVADLLDVYDLARPRLNVITSLLRDLAEHSGVDVSTGLGFLPVILARYGLDTVATERHPGTSRFATAHGIAVHPYRLGTDSPPLAPQSANFLIFAEVLEHLKLSPHHVLGELRSLLRPGGRLILTTPNIARLAHVEALIAGENFLEPFPESVPYGADATDALEHVREYSVREVVELVEGAGFGIDQVVMTGWGDAGYHPLSNPYTNEIMVVVGSV